MAQKGDFMERDYGMEIDVLKKELEEVKGLLRGLVQRNVAALGQPAMQAVQEVRNYVLTNCFYLLLLFTSFSLV